MASSLGITLGIVAGAAAIGLTAGLAAPALGLAGATALSSGAVLGVGGAAFSLGTALAAGALAFSVGTAVTGLGATSKLDPVSQVHRQMGTTSDSEAPWEWVYGEVAKGAAVAWQGVGGDEDQYSGADFVVACHACEAIVEIQVGDWCFPIVTSVDGNTNYNGLGLILNTGQTVDPNVFPADWYVPVTGGVNGKSQWNRNPQDDNNTGDRPHIGVKINYGDRTATEPHMAARFGTKYSSVARKFTGHTVVSMITRVHDDLGTGSWPEVRFRVKGKKDIRDHTGGNAAYRNNCAYVFADYCRERWGIPVTKIVGVNSGQTLQGLAAECDDTTWSGAGGEPRYTFDGVIRDDEEPTEVLRKICQHMAGDYSERGDAIAVFTGTVKTAWSDGPLTYDDVAEVGGQLAIDIVPPDEDAWANTLIPHRVVLRALDEDGKRMIHGLMEPTKQDVSPSAYITEDGGEVLRQDIKFSACTLGRRAKWLAWIALKQMRLGASMEVTLKKRAAVLEKGDVVTCNFPDFFTTGTKFQVASKRMVLGPDTFAVRLGLVRYEDAIYTPDTTPTEDAIGVVATNRSAIMPAITGLAATVLEDSAQMNADGKITVDVQVSWDLVPNAFVRGGGDVRVAWKRTAVSWPQKGTTVPGDEIQAVLPGLRHGFSYHIRARAEGKATAGRTGKPMGPWTQINFTPDALADETSPPRLPGEGQNLMEGSRFESRKHREKNFTLIDTRADGTAGRLDNANMTVDFQATGGFFGPYRLRVREEASSEPIGDTWRIDYVPYIPTEWGRIIRIGIGAKRSTGSNDVLFQLALRFYDVDKGFLETQTIDDVLTVSSGLWHFFSGKGQAPQNAAYVRPQLIWKKSSGAGAAIEASFDGWYADDVPLIQAPKDATESTIEDGTQEVVIGLGNRDIAGQGYLTNGTEELEIEWQVRGWLVHADNTNPLSTKTKLRARLVRNDFDGVLSDTVIDGLKVFASMPAGANMANEVGDEGMLRLASEDAPPAGEWRYRIECSLNGDTANADGVVTDKKISIRRI